MYKRQAQRYWGRYLFLAAIAVMQAVICCVGVLALGVQTVSAPALIFAAALASLAYLSIIYAFSVTLQHIGKGICVILVFAQIPGGTGIYPVEMTSAFFQAVYPFLPFTYGINAMREAICGFYGNQYLEMLGMLVLFFALFMALGLLDVYKRQPLVFVVAVAVVYTAFLLMDLGQSVVVEGAPSFSALSTIALDVLPILLMFFWAVELFAFGAAAVFYVGGLSLLGLAFLNYLTAFLKPDAALVVVSLMPVI